MLGACLDQSGSFFLCCPATSLLQFGVFTVVCVNHRWLQSIFPTFCTHMWDLGVGLSHTRPSHFVLWSIFGGVVCASVVLWFLVLSHCGFAILPYPINKDPRRFVERQLTSCCIQYSSCCCAADVSRSVTLLSRPSTPSAVSSTYPSAFLALFMSPLG